MVKMAMSEVERTSKWEEALEAAISGLVRATGFTRSMYERYVSPREGEIIETLTARVGADYDRGVETIMREILGILRDNGVNIGLVETPAADWQKTSMLDEPLSLSELNTKYPLPGGYRYIAGPLVEIVDSGLEVGFLLEEGVLVFEPTPGDNANTVEVFAIESEDEIDWAARWSAASDFAKQNDPGWPNTMQSVEWYKQNKDAPWVGALTGMYSSILTDMLPHLQDDVVFSEDTYGWIPTEYHAPIMAYIREAISDPEAPAFWSLRNDAMDGSWALVEQWLVDHPEVKPPWSVEAGASMRRPISSSALQQLFGKGANK